MKIIKIYEANLTLKNNIVIILIILWETTLKFEAKTLNSFMHKYFKWA